MKTTSRLNDLLARLKSEQASVRDLAAAEIGDLFEYDQLDEREFKKAVHTLVPLALAETDPNAKESMFNALSEAGTATRRWPIDWHPLALQMASLTPDCLIHVLVILGFSGETAYRAMIEPFLRHPDETVRTETQETLKMLAPTTAKSRTKVKRG
jgi:hypothetical protein